MVHLIVASVLMSILAVINWKLKQLPSWKRISVYLLFGALVGILIDYIFGYLLHLWSYTHHGYWLPDYFLFLIPAWSLTLTIFILFYSILERLVRNIYIRLVVFYAVIPLEQEFMGAWQNSWSYNSTLGLMISGWILLMSLCVFVKQITDWLSSQNFKIERYSPLPEVSNS